MRSQSKNTKQIEPKNNTAQTLTTAILPTKKSPTHPLYTNREIAWLSFNDRVLCEAADPSNPIVERMIFLGIFSSNNDEFFRVRVASLKRLAAKQKNRIEYHADPIALLKEIRKIVNDQLRRFEEIFEWNTEELKKHRIHLLDESQISPAQGRYIKSYFHQHVRRHLYPVFMERLLTHRSLRDKSNFLAVQMWHKEQAEEKQDMIIEIPVDRLNRFLKLPDRGKQHYVVLLDDVIRYCLSDIFAPLGYDSYQAYTFKFIRDAELDIEFSQEQEENDDFINYLSKQLKDRNQSNIVRLVHDAKMPPILIKRLQKLFNLSDADTFNSGGRYQNKKDFTGFPRDFGNPKLLYPKFVPQDIRAFPIRTSKFEILRKQDIMLHYPYQSFQHIIDLIREASMDPLVKSIKMTIYRVAKDSSIMNALINAARNGKKVSVFMELMARFDEENNINWVKRLEVEGIEVYKIIPGVKVHAKLLLIERKENGKSLFYAAVGTGNPNESTAKQYIDIQLLTSDPKITLEVKEVFKTIGNPGNPHDYTYHSLLVSPRNLRSGFEERIDREIANAKAGKPAWMKICLNNLADAHMVDKLYEAGKAKVKIQMIVRGICILKPGVKGLSENIEAISIVDRFLEHTRVFIFCNNEKPEYYIGSADWMTRNLDHRIEVDCPIYDKEIQNDLFQIINLQLMDNTHA
ncbi:MAG: polyphosphate kinase 1, partial [Bacteroidales bacterium]